MIVENKPQVGHISVPGLVKIGKVYGPICEATPVVWKDRLLLLENIRPASGGNASDHFLQVRDVEADSILTTFGRGYSLASAFVWKDTFYVYAARHQNNGWHDITEFTSTAPLLSALAGTGGREGWSEPHIVIHENPVEQLFNQSVCRADDRFVMAYESNAPRWPAFTVKFAESDDLKAWRKIPERIYAPDRYTACPCLRYVDGWFYMMYLEHLRPRWWFETYMVRSRDLTDWELSPRNPIIAPNPDGSEDCNTSDPDLCEFKGKILLYYSYGDQRTWTKLTRAEYPGSLTQFFRDCYE